MPFGIIKSLSALVMVKIVLHLQKTCMINVHFIMMYILYFLWDFTDDENVDTEKMIVNVLSAEQQQEKKEQGL